MTSYSSHEPSKNTEKAVWQTEDWFQIWPFYQVWRARSYFHPYCEKIMLVCDQINSPAFSNSTSTPLNVWHHNWHTSSFITCRVRPLPRWTFATVSTQYQSFQIYSNGIPCLACNVCHILSQILTSFNCTNQVYYMQIYHYFNTCIGLYTLYLSILKYFPLYIIWVSFPTEIYMP